MGKIFPVRDDVEAEKAMQERGIVWTIGVIALNQIEWAPSNINCGRMKNFTESQTQQMREDKAKGDTFPRCIVAKMANGKYLIVSGWNRINADRSSGATHSEVYIVDDDAYANQSLAAATNSKHGIGVTREEKIALAVAWMQRHGKSGVQADKEFNLPNGTCAEHQKSEDVARSMLASGVPKNIVDKTMQTHRAEMYRLANKPTVLRHITMRHHQNNWTTKELNAVAKQVVSLEDIEECDQKIKELGLAGKSERTCEPARPHQRKILQAISLLIRLEEVVETRAASQLTRDSIETLRVSLPKAEAVLARLKKLLY